MVRHTVVWFNTGNEGCCSVSILHQSSIVQGGHDMDASSVGCERMAMKHELLF